MLQQTGCEISTTSAGLAIRNGLTSISADLAPLLAIRGTLSRFELFAKVTNNVDPTEAQIAGERWRQPGPGMPGPERGARQ
jgi:hypothetical protein